MCLSARPRLSQTSPMGPDLGGAYTCFCCLLSRRNVQCRGTFTGRNLQEAYSRSSSLCSPKERGAMLSRPSAGSLQGWQHRCPSQGTDSPSYAPAAGWTLQHTLHSACLSAPWMLLRVSNFQGLAASDPPLYVK